MLYSEIRVLSLTPNWAVICGPVWAQMIGTGLKANFFTQAVGSSGAIQSTILKGCRNFKRWDLLEGHRMGVILFFRNNSVFIFTTFGRLVWIFVAVLL